MFWCPKLFSEFATNTSRDFSSHIIVFRKSRNPPNSQTLKVYCPLISLLANRLSPSLSLSAAPPKFLRTPNDQTGVQGGVASFVCQATGDPRPKIVWNKKGKKVSNQRFEVLGLLF